MFPLNPHTEQCWNTSRYFLYLVELVYPRLEMYFSKLYCQKMKCHETHVFLADSECQELPFFLERITLILIIS